MEMMEHEVDREREKYQITYSVIQYWSIFIKEKREKSFSST